MIETEAGHPLLHEPSVLPRGQATSITATGKMGLTGHSAGKPQVLIDLIAYMVADLGPNRSAGFLLPNDRAGRGVAAWHDVVDGHSDHVAAAKLTINRQIEEGEFSVPAPALQLRFDRPRLAWAQLRLRHNKLSLSPRALGGAKPKSRQQLLLGHTLHWIFSLVGGANQQAHGGDQLIDLAAAS